MDLQIRIPSCCTNEKWIEMCLSRLKPLKCSNQNFNSMNNDNKNKYLQKLLNFVDKNLTKDVHNKYRVCFYF